MLCRILSLHGENRFIEAEGNLPHASGETKHPTRICPLIIRRAISLPTSAELPINRGMTIPSSLFQGIPPPFCPCKICLFEVQDFPPHFDIPTVTALFRVIHGAVLSLWSPTLLRFEVVMVLTLLRMWKTPTHRSLADRKRYNNANQWNASCSTKVRSSVSFCHSLTPPQGKSTVRRLRVYVLLPACSVYIALRSCSPAV